MNQEDKDYILGEIKKDIDAINKLIEATEDQADVQRLIANKSNLIHQFIALNK